MLPLLRIGDLWSEGKLLQQPDYELEIFPDVEITAQTTTLVKAGLNKDGGGFLLPLNEHPWHRRCTHSYCVEVALDDRRRLLVPCMELIRFYFGSSSKLINASWRIVVSLRQAPVPGLNSSQQLREASCRRACPGIG